ncbi:FAD-binding protein [Actinomadura litoris]|uniref:FAD-binding protein n=1 Tax=Actinomadura litoris TaxID=2678616 RepID=A0A7K1L409_9ACTN|nr:FAD-binding protein [Actinomadura litoris]MUN39161.1 FAD-binding protein [Actinomadura litoris]
MRDFGGVVERTPARVVRPGSAEEVAAAVREAAATGLEIVPRGAGHSTYGQSLTGGVCLDMRGLAGVREVGPDRAVVGAGTTWREVLDATLPHGLTPPVLTDFLDVTVGGTLSSGGVGGASHLHGTQAANVLALDVVVDGRPVSCSPTVRPEVFEAVRAGLGAHGVITGATLRLVPAPDRVLSCTIPCRDTADLLRVQREVRADHLSGQAKPSAEGWRYEAKAVLHLGTTPPHTTTVRPPRTAAQTTPTHTDTSHLGATQAPGTAPPPTGTVQPPGTAAQIATAHADTSHMGAVQAPGAAPPPMGAVRGLGAAAQTVGVQAGAGSCVGGVPHAGEVPSGTSEVEELSFLDFADRLRPDVAELTVLGEWARPHPWGMVFLPGARAAEVIEETLASMTAAGLGLSGVVLVKALRIGDVPMLAAPADPVLFSLLRTASPGCAGVAEMLAGNRALLARAEAVGGTRYAVDSVPGRRLDGAASLGQG